ncbi:MAG: PqqD family protein [Gemmatimonadota bacterium]
MITTYRPSSDVLASHLDEETVLLHLGSKRYHRLNATAAAIWRILEANPSDTATLAARMVAEFEVTVDEAESAVGEHLGQLTARELVVVVEDAG